MKGLLIIVSFIFCSSCYTQPITLTILGRTRYTAYPKSYIYQLYNREQIQSGSEIEQLKFILDSLSVNFHIDTTYHPWSESNIWMSIDFYTYNVPHFELLKEQSNQLGLSGRENYEYANKDFTYEDALASLAYQDALKRVNTIAHYLGKKIIGVRHVDDYVEEYLFYPELIPKFSQSSEEANAFLNFLELLSAVEFEAPQPERSGQYALWVTFEVK